MKSLVVYSTLTGNTKMVAEAVAEVLPQSTLVSVQENPNPQEYDLIAVGYWVDKGMPDAKTCKWLEQVNNAKIIFFGTLGAYPDSDHAKQSMEKGEALVNEESKGNIVLGSWLCQGKVDPKLLSAMAKMTNAHPMTPERQARIEEAKKHPNQQDCENAQEFIKAMLKKLENIEANNG